MNVTRYLLNNKAYILTNIIILGIGYYLISIGFCTSKEDPQVSNIKISIGTSLIATGIVVALDLWRKFNVKKINQKMNNIIIDSGIQWVSKKRDLDRYDKLVNNLENSLDICGYSLSGFFESFSEIIKKKAAKSTVKIRVLFVDTESDAAIKRAKIEGKSIVLFREKIDTFKTFYSKVENVEIRIIDMPLSSMIYRIDDVMFIGPHFYKKQSKSTLTIELSKGQWLFNEYQEEFDRMWSDAKPI
ncbi:hypothetical protein [Sphingobacterium sp. MYb388]|uniref:hypothetical protein n=1 Tax=Sphingobacterium sp. MYb388 TaxID=2745437 RepID=UPI0030977AA2